MDTQMTNEQGLALDAFTALIFIKEEGAKLAQEKDKTISELSIYDLIVHIDNQIDSLLREESNESR